MSNPSTIGSFSDLASVKANTVEKPKKLPTAPYIARITGPFKEHKSAKKGTLAMRFPIKLIGCHDENVQAQINEDEGLGKAMERDYTIDFWMTPDSLWRFTSFATAMGISDDLNLLEMGESLVASGEPFLIMGTNEPGEGDDSFFRLDNPAPLPA